MQLFWPLGLLAGGQQICPRPQLPCRSVGPLVVHAPQPLLTHFCPFLQSVSAQQLPVAHLPAQHRWPFALPPQSSSLWHSWQCPPMQTSPVVALLQSSLVQHVPEEHDPLQQRAPRPHWSALTQAMHLWPALQIWLPVQSAREQHCAPV